MKIIKDSAHCNGDEELSNEIITDYMIEKAIEKEIESEMHYDFCN